LHLLFGARQTGKSTLIRSLLPRDAVVVDLSSAAERGRYLARPDLFEALCRAIPGKPAGRFVFVDEAQVVPAIFDSVRHLCDSDRKRWRFLLCGSSMRKLRKAGANLLPGRSFIHHLYPLVLAEQPGGGGPGESGLVLPLPGRAGASEFKSFPEWPLEARLAWGALPGVVAATQDDRPEILKAYTAAHLEEEIRREALVKDWGAFLRFLQLAALESRQMLNYAALAQETGISLPTVKSHYQLLEDMHAGFSVPAWPGSSRKRMLSTPRFFLFDLGVRHAAAGLTPSLETVRANPGPLFEQWVGLELWKRLKYLGTGSLHYYRTRAGAEVDFVIEREGRIIPVEAKWTERPGPADLRHLVAFMRENGRRIKEGFVVCRCHRPLRLAPRVTAIPWWLI
jgi:predicted AAA+ superfamily ATPase